MLTPVELEAFKLSLWISLSSVLCNLPIAILIAWLIGRYRFTGRALLDACVHLPLVLPPVVTGYLLLMLLGIHGPIGHWLYTTFQIRLAFTTTGAIIATAVMSFPFMVRAIRLSIEGIPRGLDEAARTLGAGPIDRFFQVTLPLIVPGILAGMITAFAAGLGEFGAVITCASNIPGQTQTLPLALYTALQSPSGDIAAMRIAGLSVLLGFMGLLAGEWMARTLRKHYGTASC